MNAQQFAQSEQFLSSLSGFAKILKAAKELWLSKGVAESFYASPLFGEGVVVGMSSSPGGSVAVAVEPGGNGDVTEKRRAWRLDLLIAGVHFFGSLTSILTAG